MPPIRSDNTVEANIDLGVIGSRETQQELAQTNALVARIGKEVETFDKAGGLGRLSVGTERIRAVQADLASMGLKLQDNESKLRQLRVEQSKFAAGSSDYQQVRRQIVETEATVTSLRSSIAKLPVELRESGRAAVGAFGDVDTSLQTFAGALTNIGSGVSGTVGRTLGRGFGGGGAGVFGAAGGALGNVGDLFAVAEQIPLFSASMGTLTQRFREGVKEAGGLGKAFTGFISGALNPLTIGMAAAAAGGLALSAVFNKIDQNAKKAAKPLLDELDVRLRTAEVARQGTASLEENIRVLEQESQLLRDNQAVLEDRLANEERSREVARDILELSGKSINAFSEYEKQLESTTSQLEENQKELEAQQRALAVAESAERRRRIELEAQTAAAERLLSISGGLQSEVDRRLQNLALFEQGSEAIENELVDLRRRSETTKTVLRENFDGFLNEFEAQTGSFAESARGRLELQLGRALDFSNLDDVKLFLERLESENVTFDHLTDAQKQSIDQLQALIDETVNLDAAAVDLREKWLGVAHAAEAQTERLDHQAAALERVNQRIAEQTQLENQLADAQADYADFLKARSIEETRQAERTGIEQDFQNRIAIAKDREAAIERRQQLAKLQTETQTREREALKKAQTETFKLDNKFQRESERNLKQFYRRLEDIEEDKRDSLFDAQLNNDVAAFEQAERQFDKQERREARNFEDQTREREDQHRIELQERRQQAQQEVQQIREQGRERIEAQRESHSVVLKESDRLERELQSTRDRWRQEDAQRQRTSQEAVHQERIAQLQAELSGIKLLQVGATEVSKGISQLVSNTAQLRSVASLNLRRPSSSSSSRGGADSLVGRQQSSSGGFGFNLNAFRSFAGGGIIGNETVAKMGEEAPRVKELILPFKPSEGLENAVRRAGIAPAPVSVQVNAPITIGGGSEGNMTPQDLIGFVNKIATTTAATVQKVMERER